MLYDPSRNWPDFGKLLKGVAVVTIGVIAIGTAGAAVGAVAAVTMVAGTALTMMGVADINEAMTGQNVIKEAIFDGNEENYDIAEEILAMVTTSGISVLSSRIVAESGSSNVGMCFTEETLIKTTGGFKEIKDIAVGDKVYSEERETGEKGYKAVKQVFINEVYKIIHIKVKDIVIESTFPHPFFVEGKGWVEAKDLIVGDILKLASGESTEVKDLTVKRFENPVKVYNFEVADWHTYYVSKHNVLVHNTGTNPCAESTGESGALKWLNKGDTNNVVYYGMKNGKEVYTGITKQGLAKRLYQHNYGENGKGLKRLNEIVNGLTRNQARAIEQYLIENGSANKLNDINSISPNHRFYDYAMRWAEEYINNLK